MGSNRITKIFFLKMSPGLTREYFVLASLMKSWDIHLIPIDYKDLGRLKGKEKPVVICLKTKIDQEKAFRSLVNRSLLSAVRSGYLSLVDITSFGAMESLSPYRKKNYLRISLPQNWLVVGACIYRVIQERDESVQKWPGGIRAKLPGF